MDLATAMHDLQQAQQAADAAKAALTEAQARLNDAIGRVCDAMAAQRGVAVGSIVKTRNAEVKIEGFFLIDDDLMAYGRARTQRGWAARQQYITLKTAAVQ